MPIIYPVSKVTRYLRDLLASETLLQDLWVSGEVSNFTRAASGHCYFSLRDATSTLRCVMFRTSSSGSQHLKEGAAVIIHGRVAIYEARGDLQVIADIVQPEGVGELQLKLEALKLKLQQEGLFEPSRKRSYPVSPSGRGSSPRRLARSGTTSRPWCAGATLWWSCCLRRRRSRATPPRRASWRLSRR